MTADETLSRGQRHGDYAGFVTRMVAFLTDRFIIAVILAGGALFIDSLLRTFQLSQVLGTTSLPQELVAAIGGTVAALFAVMYDVGSWTLAGQTPGKRLMGLLVVRANGERLKLGRALLRWLGYWLSGILFLGFLWVLVDSKRQAFHDKLARTIVVYSRPGAAGVAAAAPIRDRLSGLGR
jgi:uncharacterized RDD family membrane protein YckC